MINNKYLCEVTIECLEGYRKICDDYNQSFFEINNYEDVFKIVEEMKTKDDLIDKDEKSLTVGLKLFSDIMKMNRKNKIDKYYLFKISGKDKQFTFTGSKKMISFCR